ncbi:MAG TPA: glycosyltransferase family 87 protein, partial [Paracoccaceae bacterium]|nr:glycosyltransferase family 87 protein [Paracoccaceae bacterium]
MTAWFRRFEAGITWARAEPVALSLLAFELIGFGYVFALLLAGRPPLLGHDFAAFWSAARLAAEGRAVQAFDGDVIGPIQHAVMAVEGTLYWHYPPTLHLLILPLGGLGYAWAFIWFTLAGLAVWVFTVARVVPGVPLWRKLAVLAAPIAWSNFVQGQNGAFVALMLVMFLLALERENWALAGFWGAALLIKPHLGVLLPLVLIARGYWRVFPWGLLFGLAFCGLATWVFGV